MCIRDSGLEPVLALQRDAGQLLVALSERLAGLRVELDDLLLELLGLHLQPLLRRHDVGDALLDVLQRLELPGIHLRQVGHATHAAGHHAAQAHLRGQPSHGGAHHAAAWLVKVDLLGAFPTFESKARALITYPRVRLGNDNLGLCKLPWVDVLNPDSMKENHTDIYINPASQELYADFYNGMLGTELTWEQIFEQTDRDINLQRVLNVLSFGATTGERDWIPDRAIGPTEDTLYELEKEYNERQLSEILQWPLPEIQQMPTGKKRAALMRHRKEDLRQLILVY